MASNLNIPFTVEILTGGTFTIPAGSRNVIYKLNNNDWVTQTSNLTLNVGAGDTIQIKSSSTTSNWNSVKFSSGSNCMFKLSGNINSLLSKDNFEEITTLADTAFRCTFQDCTGLTSAEDLLLPATTLGDRAYAALFQRCSNLTIAPLIPNATLSSNSLEYMFDSCSKLNNIRCLLTDISANQCTLYWTNSVSSTGTFYKATEMENWTRGRDGIPNNWAIVNYIQFSISIDTLNLSASGGSGTVDVSSENPWTASTQSDWISITPISGLTDATVTISTNYNSFEQRTGTVTFTDGEDTIDLTVYQKGNTLIPFKKMYKNGNRIN